MRRDGQSRRRRLVHQGLQLSERERGRRSRGAAEVGVHLDDVGPVSRLLPDRPADLGLPRHHLRALGQLEVWIPASRSWGVGCRRGNSERGGEHPWPGNQAVGDCVPHGEVGPARAFRTQIPKEGEAGQESALGIHACHQRPVGPGLSQDLVVPQGLIVRVQEQV